MQEDLVDTCMLWLVIEPVTSHCLESGMYDFYQLRMYCSIFSMICSHGIRESGE